MAILFQLAKYLVVGLVLSIVDAWVLSYRAEVPELSASEVRRCVDGGFNWRLQMQERFGITTYKSDWSVGGAANAEATREEMRVLCPPGADLDQPPEDLLDRARSGVAPGGMDFLKPIASRGIFVAGWPMRSFWCEPRRQWIEVGNSSASYTDVETSGMIRVAAPLGETDWGTNLPLRPIWSGLAINTALFAAASYASAPAVLYLRARLRARRGNCTHCNYDLRGANHAVCPECGAAVATYRINQPDTNTPPPAPSSSDAQS